MRDGLNVKLLRRLLGPTVGLLLASCASRFYVPPDENQFARRRHSDAKFGVAIHWGLFSQFPEGAWAMEERGMTGGQYEALAAGFQPGAFDAEAWADLVRDSGARYLVFTAKHHDGFSMFGSAAAPWNVRDATFFGRDPLLELARACNDRDLRLFVYYSLLDWRHPEYAPLGRTGRWEGRPAAGSWTEYLGFVRAQMTELMTGYGPIGGVWLDGWWDKPGANWRLRELYDAIHAAQPGALVGNNHHRAPMAGEDFQIFESDLPGENASGLNANARPGDLLMETALPIGEVWGRSTDPGAFKSSEELIRALVGAAGRDANLLVSVAARADGSIPPEAAERLRAVGDWLERNGPSIRGTRGGPLPPGEWGASTRKGRMVYLHYLAGRPGRLAFASSIGDARAAYLFSTGESLDLVLAGDRYELDLPAEALDPLDTIVVLELTAPPR
jgi:alpha-L-fucosidase